MGGAVVTLEMKIREERREAAIENTIEVAKELNADHNMIIMLLQKYFNLSPKEAEETLNNYEAEEQNK